MKQTLFLLTTVACLMSLTGMDFSDHASGNAEKISTEDQIVTSNWDFENPDYWLTPDDEETCGEVTGRERHWGFFHYIPNTLIEFAETKKDNVGEDFFKKFGWRDDNNIVNFILYTGITPEEFADHVYPNYLNQYVDPAGSPGYYLEVIYSGDWELIQKFYTRPANPDTGR